MNKAENIVRKSARASGKVQGVGFRFFVQSSAEAMGITGWVKNLNDGSVRMELQGKEDHIELLISKIRSGNYLIKVENLELFQLLIIRGERSFEIRY